ncbi:aminotransferase class I/II-fold pyridoxal phosphate-dependent enzyme [Shimia abyssi]|uniref:L-seryl-tRNA(Ser) seleniumtransferase n=1 Tax=Shimia abyssi TaxID=1662395 RepID=A0A2P8F1V8_9RHOB|nr:aminotransferase class I/II-fold pyridoxal phosphate-dependent enzyme [Shimia abyssi]PSL15703.1 L-seryl-tRNA(Ser) seleniumtransferase [Shimia abyssi]
MSEDQFGNPIDPSVGYARGALLAGSADEVRRLAQGGRVAADFVAREGIDKIAVCTGNLRFYPVDASDLPELCEEWVGPGLYGEELRQAAIAHMGGDGDEAAAVVNRTSAGIVAAVLAHSANRPVLSLVPAGDRSHASVARGAKLAGVPVIEAYDLPEMKRLLAAHVPSLVVITTVTSELAMLDDALTAAAVRTAKRAGCVVFLDEAYGARFRPVLHGGAPSLSFGADLVITNADKAGLSGPRAGVLCGDPAALVPVQAKASELGMEARAPIAVGAMRSLQGFAPKLLTQEAQDGQDLAAALEEALGNSRIKRSALGPKIDEQDAMQIVLEMAKVSETARVPAEVTAAVGMLILRDKGIVTVNTHGQPGGRVSIRLKPTSGAVARAGGATAVACCLVAAFDEVANHLDDDHWFSATLFGER